MTGGGSGAGAAIARALAGAGANVTIAGRNADALAEVAGAEMRFVTGDVTKPDEVRAMFDAASAEWGAPSIVVANAGGAASRPFLKTSPADFAAMVDLNLGGVFSTWHAALAPMLDAGWGRLIAVASTAGLKGYPYVAGYCAAKHGVIGLTRALALETARDRRHRQRRLPRLHADPDAGALDRDHHGQDRPHPRRGRGPAPRRQPAGPLHRGRRGRRRRPLALLRRRRLRHRPGDLDLGRRGMKPPPLRSPSSLACPAYSRRPATGAASAGREASRMTRIDPLPDAASKSRLRLWLRILSVSRTVEAELRERLRALDTTLPRFDVMAALHRAPTASR